MRITALVENISHTELKPKHGLSLYIETQKHKLLFDLGPDDTLFQNSKKQNIDLSKVDTVVLSHGHMDHGGALRQFLDINKTAKIYVQESAFQRLYSKFLFCKINIGLERSFLNHPQIEVADGDYVIDEELTLFTVQETSKCYSDANNALYTLEGKDTFRHEQNLIIYGEKRVLVMGCGHTGIVNILERADEYSPEICIGGYHLYNPITRRTVSAKLLDNIASELNAHDILFYTCHCTGEKAYEYLAGKAENLHYLSCGKTVEI